MTLQLTTHQQLSNEQKITKKSVHKLFKEQSSHINDNQNEIVNILGINNILDEFLSDSNNINITQIQLHKLHQLFITPQKYQQHNKLDVFTKVNVNSLHNQEICIKEDEMCYKFDVSNTYLHTIWGEPMATKILDIFHKPATHVIWCISAVAFVILKLFFEHFIFFPLFELIMYGIVWNFYVAIWLLSANKYGLKLLTKTFEFWFKLCTVFVANSIHCINKYVLIPYTFNNKYLRITVDILLFSNIIFAVLIISIFDSLHISRWAKVLISTIISISFTGVAIQLEYETFFNGDQTAIDLPIQRILSLRSIQINLLQILAIFSWKQAFFTMIKRNRCVLIKYSPYIEWIYHTNHNINDKSKQTLTNDNIVSSTVTTVDVLSTNKYVKNKLNNHEKELEPERIEVNDINITTKDIDDSISTTMTSTDIY